MGVCKVEACEECTQKCLVIHHGRKDPSPIVTSFFKVMIGDLFSTVLFVPPKFARTIASLVDSVTYLEDSKGQRWRVTLSMVDGSLAIQKGWLEFSLDHSLEIGDVLLFSYISGSHFVVQIYGASGCEKLNFCAKRKNTNTNINNKKTTNINIITRNTNTNTNNRKGKRIKAKCSFGSVPWEERNSSGSKVPSEMTDKSSVHEQGSNSTIYSDFDVETRERKSNAKDVANLKMAAEMAPTGNNSKRTSEPVRQVECAEVPFYMIDRNLIGKQESSVSSLFDLSNFEMINTKSSVDMMEKKLPVVLEKETPHHSLEDQEMEEQCHVIIDEPVGNDGTNIGVPVDEVHDGVPHFEMPDRNYNAENADKVPLDADELSGYSNVSKRPAVVDSCQNEMGSLEISNGELKRTPFSEEQNCVHSGTDEVTLLREYTPLENGGRVPQITTLVSECSKIPVTMQANDQAGKGPQIVDKEHVEKLKEKRGNHRVVVKVEPEEKFDFGGVEEKACGVVKTENIDSDFVLSPSKVDFFCSAPAETQSYLELPIDLPSFSSRGKRTRSERKIVLLRDSSMRKWPVLYHERSGFRVLASGWEALAKANNIQPGDVCDLRVDKDKESLLQLQIHRK